MRPGHDREQFCAILEHLPVATSVGSEKSAGPHDFSRIE
jgi:hypothetical protein